MNHLRRRLAATALAAASIAGAGAVLSAGPADAAVTIGDVTSFAVPAFDACNHTVSVAPETSENLNGNFTVLYRIAVYDWSTQTWTWSGWQSEDGITFATVAAANPFGFVYMQYAKVINGTWVTGAEWAPLKTDTLDNDWCNTVNVNF